MGFASVLTNKDVTLSVRDMAEYRRRLVWRGIVGRRVGMYVSLHNEAIVDHLKKLQTAFETTEVCVGRD
jgi:hypothetical protein